MIDQKHNRSPDKKSQKDRIKEITARLEEGVKAVFESNRYKEYLACMSKFHSYSLNTAGPQGRERDQDPGTVQI